MAELAVKSTAQDHPDKAVCLNNLGNMLQSRYERTGEMKDLEEAIRVYQSVKMVGQIVTAIARPRTSLMTGPYRRSEVEDFQRTKQGESPLLVIKDY